MDKITELDASYEQFMKHLSEFVPEGIAEVDLQYLNKLNLLKQEHLSTLSQFTRFFHVVESREKVTLFNDQFVVWIVPDKFDGEPKTLVLVAINGMSKLRLETGFATAGVYNTSKVVLRIIEKLLADIQENEELISRLEDDKEM